MEIKKEFPPNYEQIKAAGFGGKGTVFCYGSVIYNPDKLDIPEDVEWHEMCHSKRQLSPEAWWQSYLTSPGFRLSEEVFAFSEQFKFIKAHYPVRAHKEALWEMADTLVTKYQLNLKHLEAEDLIRKNAR